MIHSGPETLEPKADAAREQCGPKGTFLTKVCGITNLEDALLSVRAGANALGFNFYPSSPRYIEPVEAFRIIEAVPEDVLNVGVVVAPSCHEEPADQGFRELPETGIDAIQIHGIHGEEGVFDLGIRTFIATSPNDAGKFPHHEIIIDSSWGSGTVADWDLILDILDRPYILSGGLTPENVAEALRKLRPDGVDVCSGVEASPGKKDPEKLGEFLSIVGSFRSDFRSNLGS